MHLIPVLDLLGGRAVRATGGLARRDYPPLRSVLAPTGDLAALALALRSLGTPAVYVADLDAIEGRAVNRAALETLQQAGLTLWLDSGLRGAADYAHMLEGFTANSADAIHWIAGLESLADPSALSELLEAVGRERLLFSLDLRDGRPLAGPEWDGRDAWETARLAVDLGVARMLLLDLAHVGRGTGPRTVKLCSRLREFSELEIVTGGGVRDEQDLHALAAAGCNAALVGAALHDGRISTDDVRRWNGD
jgi:phosphoribosylformimino-5-aminoimidazole carboxamide ribotide isomerase